MIRQLNSVKRTLLFLLCCVCVIAYLPMYGKAIGKIDEDSDVILNLDYHSEAGAMEGVVFRVYKVADVKGHGEIVVNDQFGNYPVTLSYEEETSRWKAMAETWAAYARMDELEPIDTGLTNSNGIISFPEGTAQMTTGLYLVVGETSVVGEYTYSPEPMLLSLPSLDEEENWSYEEEAVVKYSRRRTVPVEEIEMDVLKIWKDDEYEIYRPKEIEVHLLKDGEIYDTVKVTEDMNWRYSWSGLESTSEWNVVEKDVPEGYTVSLEQENNKFYITNTYEAMESPEETESSEESESPEETESSEESESPEETESSEESTRPEETETPGGTKPQGSSQLPQTGMLWWPVPILALSGILLFVIGWIRYQNEQ